MTTKNITIIKKQMNKPIFSTFNIIVITFYILLLFGTLNSLSSTLFTFGYASILIVLAISNLLFLGFFAREKYITKIHLFILFLCFIYLLVSFVGLIGNPSTKGMINIAQFLCLILFSLFISLYKINKNYIPLLRNIAISFLLIHFFYWLTTSHVTIGFKSFYPNPNLLGIFLYLNLFFILILPQRKLSNTILIFASLVLINFTETRSVYLSLFGSLLTFIIWPFISKNKKRFFIYFSSIIIILLSFVFIYPYLSTTDRFLKVNSLLLHYTGKNLFSGRETLWSILINKVLEKPFWGYGPSTTPKDFINSNISSHNYYLQISLQNGFLGLFILILIFLSFWFIFWKGKTQYIVRLAASFFIGTLIYQNFEVSLTQNQLSSGIIQWFIIGIGLSFSLYNNSEEVEQAK